MPAPSSSSVLPWLPMPDTTGAVPTWPTLTPTPGDTLASVRVSNGAADVAIAGVVPTGFRMPLTSEMRWTSRLLRALKQDGQVDALLQRCDRERLLLGTTRTAGHPTIER